MIETGAPRLHGSSASLSGQLQECPLACTKPGNVSVLALNLEPDVVGVVVQGPVQLCHHKGNGATACVWMNHNRIGSFSFLHQRS